MNKQIKMSVSCVLLSSQDTCYFYHLNAEFHVPSTYACQMTIINVVSLSLIMSQNWT